MNKQNSPKHALSAFFKYFSPTFNMSLVEIYESKAVSVIKKAPAEADALKSISSISYSHVSAFSDN